MLGALSLWLCLGGAAGAGTVRGVVQFPDEVKGGALRHGGYWRVPNGVLPLGPALHDVRAEAVVVLVPQGAAGPSDDRRKRAEVHLAGLRMSPPVSVVAPGATVTLINEDRVPHKLVCPAAAAVPRQEIAAGARASLTLSQAGEYVLVSEEYAHLTGAVLVIDRALSGRVEPTGAFQIEAPPGRYEAKVFWRGAFVAAEPVDVPDGPIDLRLKATLPGAPKAPARPAGQPS